MQITLNKNSWHYKYFEAIVGSNPPKSLCPYFWIMVFLIITSPFIGLFFGINKIVKFIENNVKFKKKEEPRKTFEEMEREWDEMVRKRKIKDAKWNKIGDWTSKAFKWVILPCLILFLVYQLYRVGSKLSLAEFIIIAGICISFALFIIGFVFLVERYSGIIGDKISGGVGKVFRIVNPFNWKITKIIGEMIKTAYTKACPLIQWEGETKKDNIESWEG